MFLFCCLGNGNRPRTLFSVSFFIKNTLWRTPKIICVYVYSRLFGFQTRAGRFEREQNLLPLVWIERRFLRCPARTIGTMQTELSRHSHPRDRTEMVVVSTLWTICCRRMYPQCLFCRRFWGLSDCLDIVVDLRDSLDIVVDLTDCLDVWWKWQFLCSPETESGSHFFALRCIAWATMTFSFKILTSAFCIRQIEWRHAVALLFGYCYNKHYPMCLELFRAINLQRPKSILLQFSLFSYTLLLLSHASFVSLSVRLSLLSRSFHATNYDLRCFGTTTIYDPPVEAAAMSQQTTFRVYTQAAK